MITFSCKNSVKNGNIHYIKYYSLLSQGDVKLAWNSSLYLLGILLTGNCYEPTYIIHVKQTLAVTNCFTRNKIVYLLQTEKKELKVVIENWDDILFFLPPNLCITTTSDVILHTSYLINDRQNLLQVQGRMLSFSILFLHFSFVIKIINFDRILNSWWTVWI